MHACVLSRFSHIQLFANLWNLRSPPGSSVHGLLQARILEWVAISSSRGSSWPWDRTHVSCGSCIAGVFFTAEPKSQLSFQSQRSAMPKNVQTTIQLCSFHMLVRLCSKSFKLGFSSMWIKNFQMYKLGLEQAEEPEIKLPTSVGS